MPNPKHSSLYTQVKAKLYEDMRTGVYQSGDRLPTEKELCDIHGVSRTTIRQALQQLELEGRIRKIQGKGTFVMKEKITHHTLAPMSSFEDHMHELGRRSESRVLEATVIPAESPIHNLLHVPLHSPVTKLLRLRLADDEPISFETSYIPWHVAPGLSQDNCTGSLFKLLKEKYEKPVLRSVETLEAAIVEPGIAKLLEIDAGSPVFRITIMAYSDGDGLVEYRILYLRSDASNFSIERRYPASHESP
ncbi:GntR family transcriptional regulator [Paenibacillus sp. GCM10027627]|uniref:GntR family transcriptional regulator n=1 Tax=unclassified Paenibacillus TaxID=185978 RepID=UPI003632A579